MGLDSVELLMETENFFKISISNEQAGKVYTVQNLVDVIAECLKIVSHEKGLQKEIFLRFANTLREVKNIQSEIQLSDKISNYLQVEEFTFFKEIADKIKLGIPCPSKSGTDMLNKFKKLIHWAPNYDWEQLTVEDFVNAICAKNYILLIQPGNIKTQYEIYIAVQGITAEKLGIDYFEIAPDKSFTNDLGID